jgi:hypothetical protein
MRTGRGEDRVDGVVQIDRSAVGERDRHFALRCDAVCQEVERLVLQGLSVRVPYGDLAADRAHNTRLVHPLIEVGNELQYVAAQLSRCTVPAELAQPSPAPGNLQRECDGGVGMTLPKAPQRVREIASRPQGTDRKKILRDRPDVLLTTPESLEAMLVSTNVDHRAFFSGLQAIVVDEVHAFAGDDRGWHLLAVLERLQRVVGRPVQRIGLSATVGNPDHLLTWLQGSGSGHCAARVIAPHLREESPVVPPPGDIQVDYVGSLENAATVIAALHRGEKRLVFCESRRQVEKLGESLRAKGVTTFLSHASLSVDERRRTEEAFARSTRLRDRLD